ncbi:Protein RarD [Pseudomonas fluorescens]|nr:Protein RarD [Pseudomonas fluorescens]
MQKTQQESRQTSALVIISSALANVLLGASSVYWRALNDVSSLTLVAYRVSLSTLILAFLIFTFQRFNQIERYTLKLIRLHCIASLLIAISWGVFIWSSINGYILESGLGYLLAPFISVTLGTMIYRERVSTGKALFTFLVFGLVALLMVLIDNLNHGTYILIALTWGLYTYLKKSTSLDAVNGLFIETLFLTSCLVPAIFLLDLPITQLSELGTLSSTLIWLAGGISTLPLLMFSYSTGKIPLSLTGFLQFLLPLTLITIALVSP